MVVLRMERWKMGCKCRKYLREMFEQSLSIYLIEVRLAM